MMASRILVCAHARCSRATANACAGWAWKTSLRITRILHPRAAGTRGAGRGFVAFCGERGTSTGALLLAARPRTGGGTRIDGFIMLVVPSDQPVRRAAA